MRRLTLIHLLGIYLHLSCAKHGTKGPYKLYGDFFCISGYTTLYAMDLFFYRNFFFLFLNYIRPI